MNTSTTTTFDINLADAAVRHYWFDDGTEGQSVIAPSGMHADAVLAECIARSDYPTPDNATYHITFRLRNFFFHTMSDEWQVGTMTIETKTVAYHPDEPDCAPGDFHEWDTHGPYGEGAGTRYTRHCQNCSVVRHNYYNSYPHGADQFNDGVVYESDIQ